RDRFDLLDAPSEIGENIFIVTQIKQVEAVTHFNQGLSIEKDREFVPDTFLHELFVIILENSKLNIFTGCGHSNVLNMLRMTKKIFPDYPIKSLFGGFHLKKPEKYSVEEQILIREIASKLENYNIEKIYTNHCTGLAGFDLLKEVLGEKIEYFGLGSSAEI
ncbi:MAG: MBL fold metallo-hydrolase, partial [Candidatus Berkelbacteria bacterium]|nr:MBL fold metallo-hydrolase [Candidatus Berkelbacteria bacterium]